MAEDADIEVYSAQSPLGSAIVGARPGEQRTYSIPSRDNVAVTLLDAVPHGLSHTNGLDHSRFHREGADTAAQQPLATSKDQPRDSTTLRTHPNVSATTGSSSKSAGLNIDHHGATFGQQQIVGNVPTDPPTQCRAQHERLRNNMIHSAIEVRHQQPRQLQA